MAAGSGGVRVEGRWRPTSTRLPVLPPSAPRRATASCAAWAGRPPYRPAALLPPARTRALALTSHTRWCSWGRTAGPRRCGKLPHTCARPSGWGSRPRPRSTWGGWPSTLRRRPGCWRRSKGPQGSGWSPQTLHRPADGRCGASAPGAACGLLRWTPPSSTRVATTRARAAARLPGPLVSPGTSLARLRAPGNGCRRCGRWRRCRR